MRNEIRELGARLQAVAVSLGYQVVSWGVDERGDGLLVVSAGGRRKWPGVLLLLIVNEQRWTIDDEDLPDFDLVQKLNVTDPQAERCGRGCLEKHAPRRVA